ncbi:ATP synthase subunit I [Francisella philomiragia]|uniref:ATP synthase I chain family protein n=1 Tax=Francisella philomiragia TaxID=28110 RepID=A0AAW3D753_9GAMM|nr:ATP synthase subunit I [Francisella philomiragia]AJI56404.1 ATP synthase I chain family protein [Francisella philomiragia]KFJ41879.1 ATP synthase I chain family protein [Francisella philomiragia]MBK2025570.1 ATP synthase subunit I [Francisella philomiragia]MBK2105839.1 ATP synthase subunit I [Francisella philomiragia]MBK2254652.1 ATP synthase subunit I [Francisella philomiragia]
MLANIRIDEKKFILMQFLLGFVGYVIVLMVYGYTYANSFVLGALTMFLANFVFFFRLFVEKQFSPGVEIVIFYLSELLKLSIVALITILLAVYVKPKLFSYIFGLLLLQLVVCFVPILFKRVR